MICCGKKRQTMFCPECGKCLGKNVGSDLLSYLEFECASLDKPLPQVWSGNWHVEAVKERDRKKTAWHAWRDWVQERLGTDDNRESLITAKLSARARKVLARFSIGTLQELQSRWDEFAVGKVKNCGVTTVRELRRVLNDAGFHVAD